MTSLKLSTIHAAVRAHFRVNDGEQQLLRLYLSKIVLEDGGEVAAVSLPVPCAGIVLQAGDPIAVEFVHNGVNPETFEPSIPKRSRIAKGRFGAAFSEPG